MVNGQIEASVEDNGESPEILVPGSGFKGMAERMASSNGKFIWEVGNPGLIIYLGAQGFLLKDVSLEFLLKAIATVHGGETLIQPALTENLIARMA